MGLGGGLAGSRARTHTVGARHKSPNPPNIPGLARGIHPRSTCRARVRYCDVVALVAGRDRLRKNHRPRGRNFIRRCVDKAGWQEKGTQDDDQQQVGAKVDHRRHVAGAASNVAKASYHCRKTMGNPTLPTPGTLPRPPTHRVRLAAFLLLRFRQREVTVRRPHVSLFAVLPARRKETFEKKMGCQLPRPARCACCSKPPFLLSSLLKCVDNSGRTTR